MAQLTHEVYLLRVQVASIFAKEPVKIERKLEDLLVKFVEPSDPDESPTAEELAKELQIKKEKAEFRKNILFLDTGFNPFTGEFRVCVPPPAP